MRPRHRCFALEQRLPPMPQKIATDLTQVRVLQLTEGSVMPQAAETVKIFDHAGVGILVGECEIATPLVVAEIVGELAVRTPEMAVAAQPK